MTRYVVVWNDQASTDRDNTYLKRLRHDPDIASRWLKGLEESVEYLTDFPGPLSHAKDEGASTLFGREVRRLLYYGPTRRRTGTPVRILFTVLPPDPAEAPETAESVIFLLRLLHGAQTLGSDSPAEE